jgi:hypothetical protein
MASEPDSEFWWDFKVFLWKIAKKKVNSWKTNICFSFFPIFLVIFLLALTNRLDSKTTNIIQNDAMCVPETEVN